MIVFDILSNVLYKSKAGLVSNYKLPVQVGDSQLMKR